MERQMSQKRIMSEDVGKIKKKIQSVNLSFVSLTYPPNPDSVEDSINRSFLFSQTWLDLFKESDNFQNGKTNVTKKNNVQGCWQNKKKKIQSVNLSFVSLTYPPNPDSVEE
jgi:hypothetical protein